jgi:hypothetical protein
MDISKHFMERAKVSAPLLLQHDKYHTLQAKAAHLNPGDALPFKLL